MDRTQSRIVAVLVASLMLPVMVPIAAADDFDRTPPFNDDNYHEYLLYNVDTAKIDVLILPPATPYPLRDIQVLRDSIQTWKDGIQTLAPAWLRDGLKIRYYTLGVDPVPADVLADPEIVVVAAEYNPFVLTGIGLESPLYACHEMMLPGPLPGDHRHEPSQWTVRRGECGSGGYTCFVVNQSFLSTPSETNRRDMFDLNSHEFGHCLGVGHVGDAGIPGVAQDFHADAYPRDDIMSYEIDGWDPDYELCVSTLNVLALSVTYAHLLGLAPPRQTAGGYVHMHPEDYRTDRCDGTDATATDVGPVTSADPLGKPRDEPARPGPPRVFIDSPTHGSQVVAAPVEVVGNVNRHGSDRLEAWLLGPFTGVAGEPIGLYGDATGGAGEATCSWSSAGTIVDPDSCQSAVVFETAGTYPVTLTVTDGVDVVEKTTDVLVGTGLFFTSTYTRPPTGSVNCGPQLTYGVSTEPQSEGKAYSAPSYAASAPCRTRFLGTLPEATDLRQGIRMELFWACDRPTAIAPSAASSGFFTMNAHLTNGAGVTYATVQLIPGEGVLVCDSAVRHFSALLSANTELPMGAPIALEVQPFVLTGAPEFALEKNFHFLIGGEKASGLFLRAPAVAPSTTGVGSASVDAGLAVASSGTKYYFRSHPQGLTQIFGNVDQIAAATVNLPLLLEPSPFTEPAVISTGVGDNNPNNPTIFHDAAAWTTDADVELAPGDDVKVVWYSHTVLASPTWDLKLFVGTTMVKSVRVTKPSFADEITLNEHVLLDVVTEPIVGRLRIWIDPGADLDHKIFYDATTTPSHLEVFAPRPLSVDAGGPYLGALEAPIPISARTSGGEGAATCLWTSADDAVFEDATACTTSVSFAAPGIKTITVTATDARGSAVDEATVEVLRVLGERVDVYVDARLVDAQAVSTDETTPTGTFTSMVDLAGLSGTHVITVLWLDGDGQILDTAAATIDVVPVEVGVMGPASIGIDVQGTWSASSNAEGLSYAWDLGDGTIATGTDVTHAFHREGTYTLTLVGSDAAGTDYFAHHDVLVTLPDGLKRITTTKAPVCSPLAEAWKFRISKADGIAPSSIEVEWSDGLIETVNLTRMSGKSAFYDTPGPTDVGFVEATTLIAKSWTGEFSLLDAPC